MKIINTIAMGLIALAGFSSCEMKDEIKGGSKTSDVGYLELTVAVDAKKNQLTKAASDEGTGTVGKVDPSSYPVKITGITDESYTKSFDSYTTLQNTGVIDMPVGNYKVESHTPGELKALMDEPYFSGETYLTILKGVTSSAEVLCKMQNTKICVAYESMFLANMNNWAISITDGSDNIISYTGTKDNPGTPQPKYLVIAENTSKLIVTVTGTKIDGTNVSESRNITKPSGSSSEYWGAADDLTIKMNINEDVIIPGISGIDIKVDVEFAESTDNVEIDVTPDDGGNTDPDPEPDPEPSDGPTITSDYLTTPITCTYDAASNTISGAPSVANVNIAATAGLKSLVVKITGGNDGFAGALEPLGLDTGKDLLTLDSNDEMDGILIEVLNPLPKAGDKSYSLDIAKFISMMGGYGTTNSTGHVFDITVTDANGKSTTASLSVIIN